MCMCIVINVFDWLRKAKRRKREKKKMTVETIDCTVKLDVMCNSLPPSTCIDVFFALSNFVMKLIKNVNEDIIFENGIDRIVERTSHHSNVYSILCVWYTYSMLWNYSLNVNPKLMHRWVSTIYVYIYFKHLYKENSTSRKSRFDFFYTLRLFWMNEFR